ncbi:DUF4233 domain-containing protein [Nocardioides stalactiti]|uniref:DUF4233 domain-containing protein n=1 Tax=Nocardioides stalactiti TaxID=2755356 RepID=UPI0016024747|nr:DUF4233 domain-containing protein [Nocardioides stalactiti]
MNNPRRSLCATVLALEAITLGLTTPVMIALTDVATSTALTIGLGLALWCLLTAGLLRAEWGYWMGHAVQVAAIALGVVVQPMFILGPVFALLWATAYRLGSRIERERAEAYAAFDAEAAAGTPSEPPAESATERESES